jgi:hypothetical protein
MFLLLVQQKFLKTLKFTQRLILSPYYYATENEEQNIKNIEGENIELKSTSNAKIKSDILSNQDEQNEPFAITKDDKEFNTSYNMDITAAVGPGIYAIVNTKSGQVYFGESDLICTRLGVHKNALEKNKHENRRLQESWSKDSVYFRFVILEYGLAWKDVSKRRIKEQQLILANANNCFNQIPGTPNREGGYVTPLLVNNTRYESLEAASRATGISPTSLKRDAKNTKKPNVVALDKEPYGCAPIFGQIGEGYKKGDIVLFSSITSVVTEGYAKNRTEVYRRIKSSLYPGWYYAAVDNDGNAIRRPYKLKPGEITYEDWKAKNFSDKQTSVD